jgi:hypothetical protein
MLTTLIRQYLLAHSTHPATLQELLDKIWMAAHQ